MTTGVAGIREKIFHSKKRMETAQKVSVIQSYFLLAPYRTPMHEPVCKVMDNFVLLYTAGAAVATTGAATPTIAIVVVVAVERERERGEIERETERERERERERE